MTWTTGARVVGCGCVAVIEWRAPSTALYAVRINQGSCGARRHTAGQRILAPQVAGPPGRTEAPPVTQPS